MYFLKSNLLKKISTLKTDNDKLSFIADIIFDLIEEIYPNRTFEFQIKLDNGKLIQAYRPSN